MAEALSAANVILAVLLANALRKCKTNCMWQHSFMVVAIYVAGLYTYVLLAGMGIAPTMDSVLFGRIFVRPLVTVVLGLIAAMFITESKYGKHR